MLIYGMIEWLVVKQGKTITNWGSSRKTAAPVSSGQFLTQRGRADGKKIQIHFYKKQGILRPVLERLCLQPGGEDSQVWDQMSATTDP